MTRLIKHPIKPQIRREICLDKALIFLAVYLFSLTQSDLHVVLINKQMRQLILINFNAHYISGMMSNNKEILKMIAICREVRDVASKFQVLNRINHSLPVESRITIPSLITGDGIDNLLSWIEVKISPPIYGLTSA